MNVPYNLQTFVCSNCKETLSIEKRGSHPFYRGDKMIELCNKLNCREAVWGYKYFMWFDTRRTS